MSSGKCTITLREVAIQFGLAVDEELMTRSLVYHWKQVCEDFLGVRPLELKGSRLSVPWLATHKKLDNMQAHTSYYNIVKTVKAKYHPLENLFNTFSYSEILLILSREPNYDENLI